MPHGGYPRRRAPRSPEYLVSSQMPCYQTISLSTHSVGAAGPVPATFTRHFTPYDCYIEAIGLPFTTKITAGTFRVNLGIFQAGIAPYYEPLAGLLHPSAWNTVDLTSANFDGAATSIQTYWMPLLAPAFSPAGNFIHIGGITDMTGSLAGCQLRTRLIIFPGADNADDSYSGVSRSDVASGNGAYTACPMTFFTTTPANLPVGNGPGSGGPPITLLTGDSFGGAYGTGYWAAQNAGNTLAEVDYILRVRPV